MEAYVMNLESRPDRMIEFSKNNIPFKVQRFNAIKTDPGWIGCTQSQLEIIKKQNCYPFAIFEDDCLLLDSWNKITKAMRQLPRDWDALWLGATLMSPIERYSRNLFRLKNALCAHAIIYNSRLITQYILNNYEVFFNNSEERHTLDKFYADDVQGKFNCFIIDPIAATQRSGYSDIENREVDYTQIIEHFNIYASN